MLNSFSKVTAFVISLSLVGIFLFFRYAYPSHPPRPGQVNQALPVAEVATPVPTATALAQVDSPLPTPTEIPTFTPTTTPPPYPDLKVGSVQRVESGPYLYFLRSPDGAKALITKQSPRTHILMRTESSQIDIGLRDLWLVDGSSGKERLLKDGVGRYAWAPDGTKVVMVNPTAAEGIDGAVEIYDLATDITQTLAKADFLGSDYAPQWLPSNEIIFVRDGQLWRINADSTQEEPLPNFKFISFTRQPNKFLYADDPNALKNFNFSPDGKYVAYLTHNENMRATADRLWLAASDGSNPRLITKQAAAYSWSPDSQWLQVRTIRELTSEELDIHLPNQSHNWLIKVGTLEATLLYQATGLDGLGLGAWSPDGKRLAFIGGWRLEADTYSSAIWLADTTAGGKLGPVTGLNTSPDDAIYVWWGLQEGSLLVSRATKTKDMITGYYTELNTLVP